MEVLKQLNSVPIYLICGCVIVYVALFSLVFVIRAYKTGLNIGMDKGKLKQVIVSSISFTVLPSISILLGVIALSGSLGIPLPWLRLSVIGALHYETSVADIAARSIGLSGLSAAEMTTTAFTTIALLMTVGIIWGCVAMIFFGKAYNNKLTGKKKDDADGDDTKEEKAPKKSFADVAMTAMFVGLISTYMGSYIAEFVNFSAGKINVTGKYFQLITMVAAAAAMGVFTYFAEKKKKAWIENFAVAGSMLFGMAAAVICGILF